MENGVPTTIVWEYGPHKIGRGEDVRMYVCTKRIKDAKIFQKKETINRHTIQMCEIAKLIVVVINRELVTDYQFTSISKQSCWQCFIINLGSVDYSELISSF